MKKLIILTPLFAILATVLLGACAHDEPVTTQTSTTTRETAVVAPATTRQTTTTHSNY